jgi:predicted nucleic acid-binding protein
MTSVYFDSSALVKLVVTEPDSDIADSLWNGCDVAFASRLAHPEVCAALASAERDGRLDVAAARIARRHWAGLGSALRPIELSEHVERRAGELARRHALRGADAVHLASVLALRSRDVIVATWDRRLHTSAAASGFAVVPAELAGP